jgi:hypothetical protein
MDVADLFAAEASNARVATIARVALAQRHPGLDLRLYFSALEEAIEAEPPPFGTKAYSDLYRGASSDARWMAISLITNAEREGDGAKRLWSLSACSSNRENQQLLKTHAVDESRHALIYLALLDLAFPGSTEPSFRLELQKLSPHYSMQMDLFAVEGSPYAKEPTIDDFLQMNIAEIRTTIHHLMQRVALAEHSPIENQSQIARILDSLLRDELNHVAYTAVLIDRIARNLTASGIFALFCKRFRDFNQITNEELGDLVFDCSVECCAKRPQCRAKAAPVYSFIDTPL